MKRISYFLLTLSIAMTLFYSAISYYMVYSYEQEKTWVEAMKNIPDSEYKVIKVNATLYSFTEDTELEYVNENVVINKKSYHIFKKQIKDNIVHLYYLRNHSQDGIDENLKEIVDDQLYASTTNKSPLKKIFKSFLNDYVVNNDFHFTTPTYTNSTLVEFAKLPNAELHSGFLKALFSPPKMV